MRVSKTPATPRPAFSLALLLLWTNQAQAEVQEKSKSILDFPMEVRKRNMVRLSRSACDECMTLEGFYKGHRLGFVLFFERALMSTHRYKAAIVNGFHEVCAELRWSRVTCGVVDMLDDREYAERYIDPKTAPAHIVVRDGQPLPAQKHQVDKLLKRPGDKEVMLAHLHDVFAPEEAADALSISSEVFTAESFARVLKGHTVVVAGAFGGSRAAVDAYRAAAQKLVLRQEMLDVVPLSATAAAAATPPKKGVKRWRRLRQRQRVAFVALTGAKTAPELAEGAVAAFVQGANHQSTTFLGSSEAQAAKALLAVTPPALEAAAAASGSAVPEDGSRKEL